MSDDKPIILDQAILDAYKGFPTTKDDLRRAIEYHNQHKAAIDYLERMLNSND